MKFTSAVSTETDGAAAIKELVQRLRQGFEPSRADLVAVFVSGHEKEVFRKLAAELRRAFGRATLIGCTAEGTIGDGQEVERTASMSALAGHMPGVRFQSLRITQEDLEAGAEWSDLGLEAAERPVFIAVADPFSIDIRTFVDGVASAFPGAPILGGLASAAHRPGQNQLLLNDELHEDGLVAVALTGNVEVDTVVSQGCRPIGKPFIVTKGEGNIVRALRNLTAMDALREIAGTLSNEEQELMQHGLFLGRAIDEYKSHYGRGDFLIQNVIGADPKSGAIAVNGEVKVGTTVQFHVRDHVSADEDLRNLLQGRMGFAGAPPEGALLFSCNGRGTRMWDEPGHDVGVLREAHAGLPVAGFFCAGEIGPVGGQNFIHGFTASIGLFRPKE